MISRISLSRLSTPALLTISLLGLHGCGHDAPSAQNPSAEKPELPVISATVMMVEPKPWPDVVRTQGTLIADEVVVVAAKVAGRVAEVNVDLGDFVAIQSQLVKLDQLDFELQVAQAEAELAQTRAALGLEAGEPVTKLNPANAPPVLEQKAIWDEAKARRDRLGQLARQNAVTEADVDQAVAAERVAEARYSAAVNSVNEKIALVGVRTVELSLARERLKDTVVTAPFEGLIHQRHVAPGTFVQVGQPIVSLVRSNPLRFQGTIPERYAHQLKVGSEVRLQIKSAPGLRVITVTRISPALDELSRSLMFEATVDNADGQLRSGLFADGEVVLNPDAESITIPVSSVVEFAGTEKVWKVVDGVTMEQVVQTGKRRDDRVEILGGLATGDTVLYEGHSGIAARIEPRFEPTFAEESPRPSPVISGQGEIKSAEPDTQDATGERTTDGEAVVGS